MDSTNENSQHRFSLQTRQISIRRNPKKHKGGKEEQEINDFKVHLSLLKKGSTIQDSQEVEGTPIFTKVIEKHHQTALKQYGFIAGMTKALKHTVGDREVPQAEKDPRIFFNISAPLSAFICGSQGSGKSHSLSCFLENCLSKSLVSKLQNPLTGLLFHYDPFISDKSGTPCEAAHLSSDPNIKVRVLCSPANLASIRVSSQSLSRSFF